MQDLGKKKTGKIHFHYCRTSTAVSLEIVYIVLESIFEYTLNPGSQLQLCYNSNGIETHSMLFHHSVSVWLRSMSKVTSENVELLQSSIHSLVLCSSD